MRLPRWTPVAAAAVLALTAGGVAAAAGHDHVRTDAGGTGEVVVNPAGHEVDEHAAFGQATAARAHEQGEAADDERDAPDDEHGRSGEEHGKAGRGRTARHAAEHGQGHAWAFGHLSPEARKQAIADMQAEHAATHPETGPSEAGSGR